MKKYIALLLLFFALFLTGCISGNRDISHTVLQEEKPETLSVYVNGNRMHNQGEEYYFNFVSVGPS